MAEDRKSAKKSATRILADSSNAKHRFGFAGERGSPITSAPKLSDLWFIEFKTVSGLAYDTGVTVDISALAKSVSHISLMTSTQPIDQYGKRIYVPTRVDFPEVTIQMYDTIDGKMFDVAQDIYSKFFKNQDAEVTTGNAEEVLTSSSMYGRKIPDSKHNYYHQHFEKITIYHFFGELADAGRSDQGLPPSLLSKNIGNGTIQKIELINPLVTSLSFSSSDYSISELRTVDMALQPENIRIEKAYQVNFPEWMSEGTDYILDELVSFKKSSTSLYPSEPGSTVPSTSDPITSGSGTNGSLDNLSASPEGGPDVIIVSNTSSDEDLSNIRTFSESETVVTDVNTTVTTSTTADGESFGDQDALNAAVNATNNFPLGTSRKF
jgi:hypothetical protein